MKTCDFCGRGARYDSYALGKQRDMCGTCYSLYNELKEKYDNMLKEEFLEIVNKEVTKNGIEVHLFDKWVKFRLKED